MNRLIVIQISFVFVVMMIIGAQNVAAGTIKYRVKRVSDSHLADLETRIALGNRVKGVAVTVPIGGGRFNINQIGRRRRSQHSPLLDVLFNQSEEEDRGDPGPISVEDFEQIVLSSRRA